MEKSNVKSQFWDNQLIELQTLNGEMFSTQINKVEENSLHIQHPVDKNNKLMKIKQDMPITVFFYDDLLGQCTFETKFIDYPLQLALKRPAEDLVTKVVRRNFFRVPATVQIYLDKNAAAGIDPAIIFTQDISGGGFSFLYPEELVKGVLLSGALQLKASRFQEQVDFKGKVVFSKKNNSRTYLNAVEFIEMSEATRSTIIKFCMLRQIEVHQKLKDN